MTERPRRALPRRTARGGLPIQGAKPPRRPVAPVSRRRGPFIGLALVVVLLTAGLAGRRIVDSGYFQVEQPAITGTQLVDEETVRAAAGVEGKQLWEVDTGRIAASVRQVVGVKDVHVGRRWPNRVTLTVEERVPAAVWRIGAVDVVVDEDGYVVDAPVMGGMPAISHLDGRPGLGSGDRVDGDAVRLALELQRTLPTTTGHRVARFEYSSNGGLDIVTDRGQRVRLGDSQNLAYKLSLWRAIEAQAKKDKLDPTEFDVRFGQQAAVR
jgi:cell division protein FtsQ